MMKLSRNTIYVVSTLYTSIIHVYPQTHTLYLIELFFFLPTVAANSLTLVQPLPSSVRLGTVVEIVCVASPSNPTAAIKWRRNKVVPIDEGVTYTIRNLQREGEYHASHCVSILAFTATQHLVGSTFNCLVEQIPVLTSQTTTLQRK